MPVEIWLRTPLVIILLLLSVHTFAEPVFADAKAEQRVHWAVATKPTAHGVKIVSSIGYCKGDPRPCISRVVKKEKAKTTLITAFITIPSSRSKSCLDMVLAVYKKIALSPRAAALPLYDASFSPPRKRWQAPGTVDAAQTTPQPSSFCARGAVKNYLRPVERLPRVRTLPSSGRLGIGPASLRIYPPSETVVTGKARFELHGSLEGSPSMGPLHWQVASSLFRIQSNSENVALVAHTQQGIASVQALATATFGFQRRVRPGIYRLDIEIKNRKGKRLRRYQQYFRALKPRSDLRLGVNSTSFRAGESGLLRVENYGTVQASYGFGYSLLNENGEEVPTGAISPNIALGIPAGTAGYCYSLILPEDLPPGTYEVLSQAGDSLRHEVNPRAQISVSQ